MLVSMMLRISAYAQFVYFSAQMQVVTISADSYYAEEDYFTLEKFSKPQLSMNILEKYNPFVHEQPSFHSDRHLSACRATSTNHGSTSTESLKVFQSTQGCEGKQLSSPHLLTKP